MVRRKFTASMLSLFGMTACARAKARDGDLLTPAQFQDRVVEEILQRHPAARIRREGDCTLHVALQEGEGESVTNLHRVYALYEAAPEELASLVRIISATLEPRETSPADRLVVLVRPPELTPEGALVRPLAGDLLSVVAIDTPERYEIAPADELRAAFKLSDQEIWDRALRTTRERFERSPGPIPAGKPVTIETSDGLAASILVFDEIWDSAEMTERGPLVVAILARDVLYVTSSRDTRVVGRLRKMMRETANDPNGLTQDLLVRKHGGWEVLR